jgi:hypothetical protein
MSTDCNSHEFLWKADRAIPMWSGEWTPPEGSSMARGYAHEITNEWRQYWIAQNAKDGWKQVARQIQDSVNRHFGVES